jgi:hypothetical protein
MLAYGIPALNHQPTPADLHRYACNRVTLRCTGTRRRVRRYWKKVYRRSVRQELRSVAENCL